MRVSGFIVVGLLVVAVIAAGLFLVYVVLDPAARACDVVARAAEQAGKHDVICPRHTELALVLTLICVAVTTLFGTLCVGGNQADQGSFSESRIRLAIALSILVLYLLFFSMAVFWRTDGLNPKMIETLTNLLMVVIPFYFGASAAAQIGKK